MIFFELLNNITLLITFNLIYMLIIRRWKADSLQAQALSGLLFGVVAALGMMMPLKLMPGIIFDGRSIILSIAGLFGGPLAAGIAGGICGAYRLYLGGAGAWVGVSVIAESAIVGSAYHYWSRRNPQALRPLWLFAFSVLVHAIMLALMGGLPGGLARPVIGQIAPPVILLYPPATVLICQLFLLQQARQRDEDALQENETRYRRLIEGSPDVMYIFSSQRGGVYFSPQAARLFGCSLEYLYDHPFLWNQSIHPDDVPSVIAAIQEFAVGGNFSIEYRVQDTRGQWHWLLDRSIGRHQNGDEVLIEGLATDITERKQTEAILAERTQFIESLLNLTPDVLYIYDLVERKNVYSNDGIQKVLGYTVEEIQAMREQMLPFLMHPDDWQTYLSQTVQRYAQAQESEQIYHQYRMRHVDGSWRWLEARETIYQRQPDGSPRQIFGVIHDTTDRKLAGEALRQSEERYRSLFNGMTEGFALHEILCDTEGVPHDYRFLEINPAFERLTGMKRADVIGRLQSQAFPNEDPKWVEMYGRVALTGEPCQFENYSPVLKRHFEVFAYRPAPRQFAVLFMDITDRRHAEEEIRRLNAELEQRVRDRTAQLESANTELEAFSYSVSHDLRAPLRHVTGFVELLNKRAPDALDDKSQHYLQVISESAQQMGRLIDDLLSFSRMGRVELSKTQVNMNQLVQEAIAILQQETQGRDILWRIEPLPDVSGDPALLKTVFTNLIANALKFSRTRPQAVIEIGLSAETDETIFYVRDNGAGFDMKYVDKLFGLFQRLHRAEEFEGTGLGLANIRRIIHRHGGRTWAEGAIDQGATVYFSLPK